MSVTLCAERTFRPSQIAGLQLWLDASVESSLGNTHTAAGGAANNGPVKYWGDLSGNGRNASRNASDPAVPTLLSGNRNGLSVLRFDTGDYIETTSFEAFPSKRGTIFVALNNRQASGFATIETTYYGTGARYAFYVSTTGAKYAWWDGTDRVNTTNTAQGWHVMAVNRTGDTTLQYWTDGVSDNVTIGNTQPAANVHRISDNSTLDIGELIYYDRSLSSAEMGFVRRYLAQKWGVTL